MKKKQWRSFEETRKFVGKLKIKSQFEWYEYCKSGNKPDDIPMNAYEVYKKTGLIIDLPVKKDDKKTQNSKKSNSWPF